MDLDFLFAIVVDRGGICRHGREETTSDYFYDPGDRLDMGTGWKALRPSPQAKPPESGGGFLMDTTTRLFSGSKQPIALSV